MRAICEEGVFRPAGPVGLPEGCVVEFDPKVVGPDAPESSRHAPCAVRWAAAAGIGRGNRVGTEGWGCGGRHAERACYFGRELRRWPRWSHPVAGAVLDAALVTAKAGRLTMR